MKQDIHDRVQLAMVLGACALWVWILYALGTGNWN